MKRILSLSLLYILLLDVNSMAGDLTLQGGLSHTQNSNYGDGVSSNLRLETPITDQLNAGIEAGYHGPQSHYPENRDEHSYGDMSGWSLMGTLSWYPDFLVWRQINPYILGGWGWSWWYFDRSQEVKDLGITVDLGNSFCQKYGAGADYLLDEHWSINLEWYWFRSSVPKDAKESDGRNSIILTDEKTLGQEETNITVGLKYRW